MGSIKFTILVLILYSLLQELIGSTISTSFNNTIMNKFIEVSNENQDLLNKANGIISQNFLNYSLNPNLYYESRKGLFENITQKNIELYSGYLKATKQSISSLTDTEREMILKFEFEKVLEQNQKIIESTREFIGKNDTEVKEIIIDPVQIEFEEVSEKNKETFEKSLSEIFYSKKMPFVTYEEKVPLWPEFCIEGRLQSPISLPTDPDEVDKTPIVKIVDYSYTILMGLPLIVGYENSVHMVNVTFPDSRSNYLIFMKNNFTYRYNITEIQFHYPTEHTLNGKKGDLEMHLIHVKDNTYANELKGTEDPDKKFQRLIIAILFEAQELTTNHNIQNLKVNSLGPTMNFSLSVYPPLNSNFYFYEGSETIPLNNCEENVNWVIPSIMELISKEQLKYFVNWLLNTYRAIGNARSVKPLNGRKVYYQYYPDATLPNDNATNYHDTFSAISASAESLKLKGVYSVLTLLYIVIVILLI